MTSSVEDARTAPAPQETRAVATDGRPRRIWPGIALTIAVAGVAFALRKLPALGVFSPMILAIALGVAGQNIVGTPGWAKPGVLFAQRRLLRVAIILLGLQLTVAEIVAVGATGIGIIAVTVVCTFLFTAWLGRMIGVEPRLAELIAAGTSICGASAVVATNEVTQARDEDVAYAIACVTVFGSVAMLVYPLLPHILGLDPREYGLWTGASIHEIAQVVAAAFQNGAQSGEFATVAKLSRVMMLAPVVIALSYLASRRPTHGGGARPSPPKPWFIFAFLALVAINSVIVMPAAVKQASVVGTSFLLSVALAAMGLETDIGKLRAKGVRPLLLAGASFAFISVLSLVLVKVAR